MKKINFVNNSEPDIDAENLNLIQDNMEEYVDDIKAEQFNSGIIQGTDNFNNYTKNGKFIYGGATTVHNNPGIWGIVEVMVTGTYILQRVTSASTNVEKTRYSTNNGTSWTSWRTILNPSITTGTEFNTGRVINGKEEYGKRINIGALPNATTKNVEHGLQDVTFTGYEGITSAGYKLPFISTSVNYNIQVLVGTSNIVIKTAEDYSTQTGYVTIYYTKNS